MGTGAHPGTWQEGGRWTAISWRQPSTGTGKRTPTCSGCAATDQGGWSVVSGTGAWASTRGGGSLVGYYYDNGPDNVGVIDHYSGRLTS